MKRRKEGRTYLKSYLKETGAVRDLSLRRSNQLQKSEGFDVSSHTKWSKSERERQILYDITYIWNLKFGTNKPIYETEADLQA